MLRPECTIRTDIVSLGEAEKDYFSYEVTAPEHGIKLEFTCNSQIASNKRTPHFRAHEN